MTEDSARIRVLGIILLTIAGLILVAFLVQWAFETWIQMVEPVVEPY